MHVANLLVLLGAGGESQVFSKVALALILLAGNVAANPEQTPFPSQLHFAQSPDSPSGCEIYYSLQAVDPNLLKLLGTPVVPTTSSLLTSPEYIQQRDWDFPSKVTPWSQRPKAEEITHRREELAGTSAAESAKPKSGAILSWALWNYGLEPFTAHDWNDLQKWFAKELPKKFPARVSNRRKPIV
jgi:hypothetical protein